MFLKKKNIRIILQEKKKQLPHLPIEIQVIQVKARVQIKEESVPKEKKSEMER